MLAELFFFRFTLSSGLLHTLYRLCPVMYR